MAKKGQFGGGGAARGSAPTSTNYARRSGEGARLTPLPIPGDEGALPYAGGGYTPGHYSDPTYYGYGGAVPYQAAPLYPLGGGAIPLPPEPPPQAPDGGLGNLLSLASLVRRIPGVQDAITGGAGETLGSLLGPVNTGKTLASLGIPGDSWLGANAAYGAAGKGGMGLIDGSMQATPGLEWSTDSGMVNTGMGPGGVASNDPIAVAKRYGLDTPVGSQSYVGTGRTPMSSGPTMRGGAAAVAPPPVGSGPLQPAFAGGEGTGFGSVTSNPMGYAIPAAMMAFAKWSDAREDKQRREAAQRYFTDVQDADRQQFGDGLSGFATTGDRYWLERPIQGGNTNAGDFAPQRYVDTSISALPISSQQYTGSYVPDLYKQGRTAIELRGVKDADTLAELVNQHVDPMVQWAASAPKRIGGSDAELEKYSAWAAKTNPLAQRYATHMRSGDRINLGPDDKVPAGYELASNMGYGSDAPKLPTARSYGAKKGAAQNVMGGGQNGAKMPGGSQSGRTGIRTTPQVNNSRVDAFNRYAASLSDKPGFTQSTPKEQWESFNRSQFGRR